MLNKIILVTLLLLTFYQSILAQSDSQTLETRMKKADIVLFAARKAIYGDKNEVKIESIKLTTSGEITQQVQSNIENRNPVTSEKSEKSKNLYLFSFPQLARVENRVKGTISGKDTESNILIVVNDDNFDIKSEVMIDGQKVDTGFDINKIKSVGNMFDQQTVANIDRISGTSVLRDIKGEFFPFLLDPLFSEGLKFKYIGKSVINGKSTNVLEVIIDETIPSNVSIRTRYFFDFATHLLVMTTFDNSNELAETKSRTFYSDYKNMSGILIPSKIKTEKIVKLKKELTISGIKINNSIQYRIDDMVVSEFSINPVIDNKMFVVNKKKKN